LNAPREHFLRREPIDLSRPEAGGELGGLSDMVGEVPGGVVGHSAFGIESDPGLPGSNEGSQSGVYPNCGTFGATIRVAYF
jgi:hypothetical protein